MGRQQVAGKKHSERIIRSTGEKIAHVIVFIIFTIYAISLVFPFVFLLMNSLMVDGYDVLIKPIELIKEEFSIFTYVEALTTPINGSDFLSDITNTWFGFRLLPFVTTGAGRQSTTNIIGMFLNTITLASAQTFTSMALTCMAAYVLAKYRFKGNSFLYTVIIVSSVIPTFGSEAATYQLMATLGLNNKLVGMLLLCGGFGGTFLYLHSFFKEIPWSFAESAMIDGASDFRIFLQIMLPLAKNGILVFTIMIFMGNWNEYWRSYLYYGGRPTLAVGLTAAEASIIAKGLPEGVYFAMMTICVVPILVFYAFFANKLMDNLNAGGIKG